MTSMNLETTIQNLIEEGKKFNWNNFAEFSSNGFPDSEKVEYISYKTRVEFFLENRFGIQSIIFQTFIKHKEFHVLGNFGDQFDSANNYILGALVSALEVLKFKVEDNNINSVDFQSNKVFVVHGHDEILKNQTEIFLREIGLEPIILHRQADKGQTIIEKFEENSDVTYAFILMTPDDISYSRIEEAKEDSERRKYFVARPNVIFEFGFFVGKLSRKRVCCIYKEGVSVPTDLNGLIYKKVNNDIEELAFSIVKDLKALGIVLKI